MPTPLERVKQILQLTDAGKWDNAKHETLALQKDLTMWKQAIDRMMSPSVSMGICKSMAAGALDLLGLAADSLLEYQAYPRPYVREQALTCAMEGVALLNSVKEQSKAIPKPYTGSPIARPSPPRPAATPPPAQPGSHQMLSRFLSGRFKTRLQPSWKPFRQHGGAISSKPGS